jgi:hypothetical protein
MISTSQTLWTPEVIMTGHIEKFLPREGETLGVAVDFDGTSFVVTRAEDPAIEIARTPDPSNAAQTIAWALLSYARDATEGDWTDFAYLGEDILGHVDDYAALLEQRRDTVPNPRKPQ